MRAASVRSRSPTTTRDLDPAEARRRIQAGSRGIWRYLDFLPVRRPSRRPARAGPDAAGASADRLAERLGAGRGDLDQERRGQPDPLVQGSGRRGRDRQGAGARLRDGRLRLDRQPRERGRRPRRRRRPRVLRLRARRPRGAEAARDRRLRRPSWSASAATTTTSTGSARSWPRPAWAFVNVNLRPYYAEGSKTIAYEIVEQLGWELPDRVVCPIASGSLFTKIGRGFQEWLDLGLVYGEKPVFNGAQAQGCSPVATAFAEGRDVCQPQRPDTIAKSLAIGDPADGHYALELARATGGGDGRGQRRGDPRRDPAAGGDDGDLHRDRRRRNRRRPRQAGRAGRARRRRAGRRLHHRRGPEDPRRDPRRVPDARDRPQRSTSFECRVLPAGGQPSRWQSP